MGVLGHCESRSAQENRIAIVFSSSSGDMKMDFKTSAKTTREHGAGWAWDDSTRGHSRVVSLLHSE